MQSIVRAEELALNAGRGRVYGPFSAEIGDGLTVISGQAGSGRTSLLLTLAGRMKASSGSLTVLGRELPRKARAVQKETAIAGFHDIDTLEESVTIGAAIRERQAWLSPWWRNIPRADDATVRRVCLPVFGAPGEPGATPLPTAATLVWDLDETQTALFRTALALMSGPRILFFDQVEQLQSPSARSVLWARLDALGRGAAGRPATAVVASVAAPDTVIWQQLGLAPQVLQQAANAPAGPRAAQPASTPADVDGLSELTKELA
ncbi:ATP-binding cassette domain-containing protein [Microterricola pindariensis]|uniref:ATP-binding cassette domain-containing protein n=1 Tax=Microterricola pindariensis TaxID=478010 RepID=UPI00105704D8|nr:ATP-binding cassette domain-containing protein [Microterricola pindariensis]